jgi:hypothetical protein
MARLFRLPRPGRLAVARRCRIDDSLRRSSLADAERSPAHTGTLPRPRIPANDMMPAPLRRQGSGQLCDGDGPFSSANFCSSTIATRREPKDHAMKRKSAEKGTRLADHYSAIGIGAVAASVGILKQRHGGPTMSREKTERPKHQSKVDLNPRKREE